MLLASSRPWSESLCNCQVTVTYNSKNVTETATVKIAGVPGQHSAGKGVAVVRAQQHETARNVVSAADFGSTAHTKTHGVTLRWHHTISQQ
jgi:hypothetical protein